MRVDTTLKCPNKSKKNQKQWLDGIGIVRLAVSYFTPRRVIIVVCWNAKIQNLRLTQGVLESRPPAKQICKYQKPAPNDLDSIETIMYGQVILSEHAGRVPSPDSGRVDGGPDQRARYYFRRRRHESHSVRPSELNRLAGTGN